MRYINLRYLFTYLLTYLCYIMLLLYYASLSALTLLVRHVVLMHVYKTKDYQTTGFSCSALTL